MVFSPSGSWVASLNEIALKVCVKLCRQFEGLHAIKPDGMVHAYICPAGYPTQGWGRVVPSLNVIPIVPRTADRWLEEDAGRFLAGVMRFSPNLVNHPQRWGAIGSFAYNLGLGRYQASTLRRAVAVEDWEWAARELKKWNRGGGRVLKGLVLRREAEAVYLA